MPTANLREVKKAAHAEVARQAPEPMSRIVRRENVRDRRATRRDLRKVTDEWPTAKYPQHVCD